MIETTARVTVDLQSLKKYLALSILSKALRGTEICLVQSGYFMPFFAGNRQECNGNEFWSLN